MLLLILFAALLSVAIINFICGIIVGGYKAIQQQQVKERLSSPRKFQSQEMQNIVNHYNKETINAN